MSTPYTPTTEQIREIAVLGARLSAVRADKVLDEPEFNAMFDRWLATVSTRPPGPPNPPNPPSNQPFG